jgi:hypothetical protein
MSIIGDQRIVFLKGVPFDARVRHRARTPYARALRTLKRSCPANLSLKSHMRSLAARGDDTARQWLANKKA